MKMKALGTWLHGKCLVCGTENMFFFDRYDAVCCMACNAWCSSACDDPDCPYCSMRPEKPSEAITFEQSRNEFTKDWLRKNYQHKTNGKIRHDRKRSLYKRLMP